MPRGYTNLAMRYSGRIRFVDRYVGSCVLFIFTLFHKLRRKSKDRRIKNILVIELVEMGASIMGYSSLRYIKEQIPDARIFVLCTKSTQESWRLLDLVEPQDVIALDNTNVKSLLRSLWKETRQLSRQKIDLIIDFELFTRISAILSYMIKSKFRAGFYGYTMGGLYRGNFLDVKCYFNQNMHIAKNLLALTKSALNPHPAYYNWNGPIPNEEIVAPIYAQMPAISERVREKAKLKGRPLIIVAPTVGNMLPMRDYPAEHYTDVIRMLLKKYPQHQFLLVGMREHMPVARFIVETIDDERCRDFTGETGSLQELLELFALADLLITNDSGNPHFAAMVGLPTVALYGPETPFMYGPLGKAVCMYEFFHTTPSITTYNHKNPPSADNESLRAIAPQKVVEMAIRVMEGHVTWRTINNEIPYLL
jgi:ADP-heptose:LPS heptosyltransferase